MNSLQLKKRAFMKLVNSIKGVVRTASGIPPLMLEDCVDNDSLINYSLHGNSVQNGTPSPDTPVEVESVGKLNNLFNPNNLMPSAFANTEIINDCSFKATAIKESTSFASVVTRLEYENLLGKKYEFYAEVENSADYIISGIVFQWMNSEGKVVMPYPLNYDSSKFGKNVTFTIPNTPPDGAVYLNMTFMLARNSTIAIGDTVTFKNVSFYSVDEKKYKIPVVARGKNLLPYPYLQGNKVVDKFTITINEDSSILLDGTATAGITYFIYQEKTKFIDGLNVGDKYTVSKNADDETQQSLVQLKVNFYNEAGTHLTGVTASDKFATGTISDDWVGMNTYIYIPQGTTLNNLLIKPMIEKSDEATEYEPYVEPVTTNIYLAEPLKAIGEYKDYIDFENQKVVRNINKINLNAYLETLRISASSTNEKTQVYFTISDAGENTNSPKDTMSNYFPAVQNIQHGDYGVYRAGSTTVANTAHFIFAKNEYFGITSEHTTNDSKLKQVESWLSDKEVLLYYHMKTPSEEPITLPQLPTIKGTTVYEIDTTIQPSQMDVTYYSNAKGD